MYANFVSIRILNILMYLSEDNVHEKIADVLIFCLKKFNKVNQIDVSITHIQLTLVPVLQKSLPYFEGQTLFALVQG